METLHVEIVEAWPLARQLSACRPGEHPNPVGSWTASMPGPARVLAPKGTPTTGEIFMWLVF